MNLFQVILSISFYHFLLLWKHQSNRNPHFMVLECVIVLQYFHICLLFHTSPNPLRLAGQYHCLNMSEPGSKTGSGLLRAMWKWAESQPRCCVFFLIVPLYISFFSCNSLKCISYFSSRSMQQGSVIISYHKIEK